MAEMKWIPVSERLPESSAECIITYHYWSEPGECYIIATGAAYFNGLQWIIYGQSAWDSFIHEEYPIMVFSNGKTKRGTRIDVIAWMPLPAPYKGNQK